MDQGDDGSRSLTATVESLCRVIASIDADRNEAKHALLKDLAGACRAAGATARLPDALIARLETLVQEDRLLAAADASEAIGVILWHGRHTGAAVQVGSAAMALRMCDACERLVPTGTRQTIESVALGYAFAPSPASALLDMPPGALADAAERGGAARLLAAARRASFLAEDTVRAGVTRALRFNQPDELTLGLYSPLMCNAATLTQLLDRLSALGDPLWAAIPDATAVRLHAFSALAAATRTVHGLVAAAPLRAAGGAAGSQEQREVWVSAMLWLAVASNAATLVLPALPQFPEVVSAVASALGLLGDLAAAAQAEDARGASGCECADSSAVQMGRDSKACAAVLGLLRPAFDAPNSALAAGAGAALAEQAGAVLRLLARPDMHLLVTRTVTALIQAASDGGCAHAACALRALRAQPGLYAVLTAAMERVVPGEEDDWAVPLVASLLAAGQPGAEAQLGACLAARPRVWALLQGLVARLGASPSGLDCVQAMERTGSAAMLLAWAAQHATPAQRSSLRSEPGLLSAAAHALQCVWQVTCTCSRSNGGSSGSNGGSSGGGDTGSGAGGSGSSGSGGGGGGGGDAEDCARACRDPECCLNAEGVYRQLTCMLLALTGGDKELGPPEPALSAVAGPLVDLLRSHVSATASAAATRARASASGGDAGSAGSADASSSSSSSPPAATTPAPGPGVLIGEYDAPLLARLEAYQAIVRASLGGGQPCAAPAARAAPAAHPPTQQPGAHKGPWPAGPPSAAAPSEPAAPPAAARACASCRRHADAAAGVKLKACAGCRAVRYCGTACQAQHWAAGHKRECRHLAAEQRGEGGVEQEGATAGPGAG